MVLPPFHKAIEIVSSIDQGQSALHGRRRSKADSPQHDFVDFLVSQ